MFEEPYLGPCPCSWVQIDSQEHSQLDFGLICAEETDLHSLSRIGSGPAIETLVMYELDVWVSMLL